MRKWVAIAASLLGFGFMPTAWAQSALEAETPPVGWRPMLVHEGVTFSYIFYQEADNFHDGVVIKLFNANPYAISYRFTVIFRAVDGTTHEEGVEGELAAGQGKTGDLDGLFWIPFEDGRSIAEVGLRGYRIRPRTEAEPG